MSAPFSQNRFFLFVSQVNGVLRWVRFCSNPDEKDHNCDDVVSLPPSSSAHDDPYSSLTPSQKNPWNIFLKFFKKHRVNGMNASEFYIHPLCIVYWDFRSCYRWTTPSYSVSFPVCFPCIPAADVVARRAQIPAPSGNEIESKEYQQSATNSYAHSVALKEFTAQYFSDLISAVGRKKRAHSQIVAASETASLDVSSSSSSASVADIQDPTAVSSVQPPLMASLFETSPVHGRTVVAAINKLMVELNNVNRVGLTAIARVSDSFNHSVSVGPQRAEGILFAEPFGDMLHQLKLMGIAAALPDGTAGPVPFDVASSFKGIKDTQHLVARTECKSTFNLPPTVYLITPMSHFSSDGGAQWHRIVILYRPISLRLI